ncbi:MAG: hypothetical protein ACXV3F_00865 [Frankiaceae bacterium]
MRQSVTSPRGRCRRPGRPGLAAAIAGALAAAVVAGCSTPGSANGANQVANSSATPAQPQTRPPAPAGTPAPAPGLTGAVAHAGTALDPTWPKTVTLIVDSVGLGLKGYLPARMPGWKVDVRGFPALMLHVANRTLQADRRPVGSVAVIMIGYNSLWQQNRYRYDVWARKFDTEADQLVATVKSLGAKKIVWVTLRNSNQSNSPPSSWWGLDKYAWYFGYVNERLHDLVRRHPEIALADWAAVSNKRGVTYDIIHLSQQGLPLMSEVVKEGIGLPPSRVPAT